MQRHVAGEDLLYGAAAIAKYMGHEITNRQVYYLKDHAGLPTFRIVATICARRSDLSKWLDEQAAKGRSEGGHQRAVAAE